MYLGKFGKIAICWTVLSVSGVIAFIKAKESIDAQRVESMRVRERMRHSNYGEYDSGSRKFDL